MSETTTSDTSQADAAFGAGFEGKETAAPVKGTPDAGQPTGVKDDPKPEYVQISKAEWDKVIAAAEKTAAHEKQFSTVFGTIGKTKQTLEQSVAEVRALIGGRKDELSTAAYTKLKDQFPELAEMTKEMVEARLAGLPPPQQPIDDDTFQKKVSEAADKREMIYLLEDYPDWQQIVGSPPTPGHAPVETPFRKWLAGKDEAYKARLLETDSPADVARAIRRFQRETKTPARSTPRPVTDDRAERLRDAVQPRGDSAAAPTTNPREDAFAAGFRGPS
jgi:hypothetical protein